MTKHADRDHSEAYWPPAAAAAYDEPVPYVPTEPAEPVTARVTGHGLRSEGAPYLLNEEGGFSRQGLNWNSISGNGRALCECGAVSDILGSAHQRKKWHRQHKAEQATP